MPKPKTETKDPTPEEIRSACEEIRKEWTERDFYRRKVGRPSDNCLDTQKVKINIAVVEVYP